MQQGYSLLASVTDAGFLGRSNATVPFSWPGRLVASWSWDLEDFGTAGEEYWFGVFCYMVVLLRWVVNLFFGWFQLRRSIA